MRLRLSILRFWRGAVNGLIAAMMAWLLVQVAIIQGLEEWMFDGCFQFRGTRHTDSNIVLIGIDDNDLDDFKEPVVFISPRLAKVVRYAHQQGAVAIGIDLLIDRNLQGLKELEEGGRGDATELGQAIDKANNVVLPEWLLEGSWRLPPTQWQWKALRRPEATDFGFVNLTPDGDHFVRRQQLSAQIEGRAHMHFALALHSRATGSAVRWEGDNLLVGDRQIPLDEQQQLRINFVGPPGSFRTLRFGDVLAAAEKQRSLGTSLKGAIVIIGVHALSQQDVHPTPYANNYWRSFAPRVSGLTSGTELHANVIATIQDEAYLRSLRWLTSLPMLLAFGAVLGVAFEQLNRIRGTEAFFLATLAAFLVHHFAWKQICIAAFTYGNWRVEMLAMLFLGLFVTLGNLGVRWLSLRSVLRVFTGPLGEVYETNRDGSKESGEERIVTVLFADIRGFSSYASKHSARRVVELLNRYFDAVIPLLQEHGGTVNQFIGDGIMVLFGAPEANPQHAVKAVKAAVAMVRCVRSLEKTWANLDCPGLRIGIGIHTGSAIVGAVGSSHRRTYTAIGDTVNSAARLEPENKTFQTEILISSTTFLYLSPEERKQLGCVEIPTRVELRGVGALEVHPVIPPIDQPMQSR